MNKVALLLSIGVVGMTGCASKKEAVDATPLNPTVVLTANTAISGYVLPDSTGSQKVFTRDEARRIDTVTNLQNWAARKFFGNTNATEIGLTNRNLSWQLNHPQKTYVECPLYGCSTNLWGFMADKPEGEDEEESFSPNTPDTCPMTSKLVYEVVDKKVTREINGFQANQYQVLWTVTNTDEKGRKDEHKIVVDFWLTSPSESMKDAWKINGKFLDNYLQAVGANDSALGRLLGGQVYRPLAALGGDIEKNNDMKLLNGKLAALKGYPISVKLDWLAVSNTCPEELEKRNVPKQGGVDDINFKDPVGSLGNLAGGLLKNKAKAAVKKKFERDSTKPLISYVYDVTSVSIEPQHDSVFMVPAGYKLTNRE